MYNQEQETKTGNLPRTYKLIATASGFLAVMGASTALTIITRLLPPLIPGGLFAQSVVLLGSGIALVLAKEPFTQLISGGIAGAILFSFLGGWWDAFYLWLAAISLGGITGFHLFGIMIAIALGWLVDNLFRGNN
jgi:hypothetical protein